VKTRSIYFYVQRNSSTTKEGILRFELTRLNVGGAMNLSTGIFLVPMNGIYHFEFSTVRAPVENMGIYLQVNGARVASSYSFTKSGDYLSGMLNVLLRLKKGDRVNIFKDSGMVMDNNCFYTHFIGWLVEEDLILP
jgi:hypothetical protein